MLRRRDSTWRRWSMMQNTTTRTRKVRTEVCPLYLMTLGSLVNLSKETSLVLWKPAPSGRRENRWETRAAKVQAKGGVGWWLEQGGIMGRTFGRRQTPGKCWKDDFWRTIMLGELWNRLVTCFKCAGEIGEDRYYIYPSALFRLENYIETVTFLSIK